MVQPVKAPKRDTLRAAGFGTAVQPAHSEALVLIFVQLFSTTLKSPPPGGHVMVQPVKAPKRDTLRAAGFGTAVQPAHSEAWVLIFVQLFSTTLKSPPPGGHVMVPLVKAPKRDTLRAAGFG